MELAVGQGPIGVQLLCRRPLFRRRPLFYAQAAAQVPLQELSPCELVGGAGGQYLVPAATGAGGGEGKGVPLLAVRLPLVLIEGGVRQGALKRGGRQGKERGGMAR